ncbi:MAG: glycosyltransferase [Chitinophagaceae bacterium]|nr:glycosyltransferase [Chitinophagaceae bacterium]
MEKHLHIISFTVPYPVDYGGVFDLFHKLPALQHQGVKIHLHCFEYGRGVQSELDKYCTSVNYYRRKSFRPFTGLPHIVASRQNDDLMRNLLADDYPVLMEGIHCTALLEDKRFSGRKCFVRLHNVEYQYYRDLADVASSPVRKFYYSRESRLLKKYEKVIAQKAHFLTVTEKDAEQYRKEFNCHHITHLPLFLPGWEVSAPPGMGGYCLYQGDLSVAANEQIARRLIKEVFPGLDISLKIAGKNPGRHLEKIVQPYRNITLIANPTGAAMHELISGAHINILPSHSATGIKLKLLNALFNGRHCVVNDATVSGTGLEPLCHIAHSMEHMVDLVTQLYYQPFRQQETEARKVLLEEQFNNEVNVARLVDIIWKRS